jgi:hypothetical protein
LTTLTYLVKCENGYIAVLEDKAEAHVFIVFADLVDWLYKQFNVSEEKKPA